MCIKLQYEYEEPKFVVDREMCIWYKYYRNILYSKYFLWILSEPRDCREALNDTRMVENRPESD